MRSRLILIVIALQFGVLAWMAAEREWVLRTGRSVLLRTAPVDPRDPMRGDFVRFRYEISTVPVALCRDGAASWPGLTSREQRRLKDRRVYAIVRPEEDQRAELVALTDREPAAGTFLRGRVESVGPHGITVRYGVEAMFTEQGRARAIEDAPQLRAGVALNIEARVSDGGLAVLQDFRWEPLGITVQPRRRPAPEPSAAVAPRGQNRGPESTLIGATVELKNHSDRPVAIVVRPDGGSFRLRTNDTFAAQRWQPAYAGAPPIPVTPAMVKLLGPGETHREELDFSRPTWQLGHVASDGQIGPPVPWDAIPANERWQVSVRIEYLPPGRTDTAGLPHADLIRHSPLRSRALSAFGGID